MSKGAPPEIVHAFARVYGMSDAQARPIADGLVRTGAMGPCECCGSTRSRRRIVAGPGVLYPGVYCVSGTDCARRNPHCKHGASR